MLRLQSVLLLLIFGTYNHKYDILIIDKKLENYNYSTSYLFISIPNFKRDKLEGRKISFPHVAIEHFNIRPTLC